MNLLNFHSTFSAGEVTVQVNFLGGRFNVEAKKRSGARSEQLNISYNAEGVRTPAEVEISAPFDAAFLSALDAKITALRALL